MPTNTPLEQREEPIRRQRRRSTGEPSEVSADKKQANNKRIVTKPRIKSTSDQKDKASDKPYSKKTNIDNTNVNLQEIEMTLPGVTCPLNIPKSATSDNSNTLTGVTESLAGVTLNTKSENQPTMATKGVNTKSSENDMLLAIAIARLKTKLLENRKKDINDLEEQITASMKAIVDNLIQDALNNITCTITKAVSDDPEIKKQKRDISQLQHENSRLTRKVQIIDSEYNKLKMRINNMEQKLLDHAVIIKGIDEAEEETENLLKNNIYSELVAMVVGDIYDERLDMAKHMEIKCCSCIGRYN